MDKSENDYRLPFKEGDAVTIRHQRRTVGTVTGITISNTYRVGWFTDLNEWEETEFPAVCLESYPPQREVGLGITPKPRNLPSKVSEKPDRGTGLSKK